MNNKNTLPKLAEVFKNTEEIEKFIEEGRKRSRDRKAKIADKLKL